MGGWEKILFELRKGYYSEAVLWIIELTTILIGLKYVRHQFIGRLFLCYLLFDFLILNIGFYILMKDTRTSRRMIQFIAYSNCLVAFVEILAYYYFFNRTVRNKLINALFKIVPFIFCAYLVLTLISFRNYEKWSNAYSEKIFGAVEFLLLIIPCIVYFLEILRTKSDDNLFERPSFWIVTGIFFHAIMAIPYNLADLYLVKTKYPYKAILALALFIVPFCLNFICLSKAFLCRKNLTI